MTGALAQRLSVAELKAMMRLARVQRTHGGVDPLRRLLEEDLEGTFWHYEGSRTGSPLLPTRLHDKQRAALEADARHRWLFWGNQVGKTTVGAVDVGLTALGRHPVDPWEPPVTQWASALTWDLWETILLPELLTWLPPDRIIDAPEPYVKSSKRTIMVRADNGAVSRIVGKSAEQGRAKYQSARIHKVWLDEEHPETIWDELQPRLVRFGGRTLATMTPLLGLTWTYHRIYEPWRRGQADHHWASHAGLQDNPAIDEEDIEALRRELKGNPSQLAARLDGRFVRPQGIALKYDPNRNLQSWPDDVVRRVVREQGWPLFAGIDFGSWRFGFVLCGADRAERVQVLEEYFSQRETLELRAEQIHEILTSYGAPEDTRIWGDSANATDITEINEAFKRIDSPYRVVGVARENKLRTASVTRLNNLLTRGALLFRRELGDGMTWKLGQSAAAEGRTVAGSRLLWEVNNWRYPKPKERDGRIEAQKQDPDDNTADGADMIAGLRYAVMSWWKAADYEIPEEEPVRQRDYGLEQLIENRQRYLRRQARTRGF